jgi:two-component system sensor histidine kinase/response regulator
MSKILVVEDDADAREILGRILSAAGHTVESAPNGREALTALLTHTPDLVLLDLLMPEMNGVGLLQVLRSYLRLQVLPVVVITGLPGSPMIEEARRLNVHAILVKGVATHVEIVQAVNDELARAHP